MSAADEAAILAERAAVVPRKRYKVEVLVGANNIPTYNTVHFNLTASDITDLEAADYTVTQL